MRRVRYWQLNPKANSNCGYCRGTGTIIDWVDYGSAQVPMESVCECVESDEDRKFEMYKINYNTGAGDETMETDDLDLVKEKADAGAAYTQQPITIEDDDGNVIASRPWCETTDGVDDCDDPIQFGKFGFYGDWIDET